MSPTSCQRWWDCCGRHFSTMTRNLGKTDSIPRWEEERLQVPATCITPGLSAASAQPPGNVRGPRGHSLCLSQWVGASRASSTGPGNPDFSPKEQRVLLHSECSRGRPWRWQTCPQPYRSLESNHPSQTDLKYLFTVLTTQFSRSTISV